MRIFFSSRIKMHTIFSTWLARSAIPYDRLFLGFIWTILNSGQSIFKLKMILFINSCPLSDSKTEDALNNMKMFIRL